MSIAEKNRTLVGSTASRPVNIADRLLQTAAKFPQQAAVITQSRLKSGSFRYQSISFSELAEDVRTLSAGLQHLGIQRGQRIVLMVRPSAEFVALTFALFHCGAVTVLIDPGMGRHHLLDCLEAVEPDGFVGIPLAQMARLMNRRRFPSATNNVTVGRRWFWGGATLKSIRAAGRDRVSAAENESDESPLGVEDRAAIIFTTGSTGPPKGVQYTHGNFQAQVDQIQDRYEIAPGGTDLAAFPLFGLFNGAMGTTTVIPDMDASKPASVDPKNIVHAIRHWECDQSFASPAVWNVVGKYCDDLDIELPSLKRVLSAGAPVSPDVVRRLRRTIHLLGDVHTPYGATESLPVASIDGTEILGETSLASEEGAGTCVGRRFEGIEWKVIEIDDGPLATIDDIRPMLRGEIGELIVSGPQVTQRYVTRVDQNELHKISDGDRVWHRIGDVGYLDDQDRFWFCGRKAHRVCTAHGTMFTIPCEAIANRDSSLFRSALVGVGQKRSQTPVMICEPLEECWPDSVVAQNRLLDRIFELLQTHHLSNRIRREHLLLKRQLPVDIRHNAKIFREELSVWAAKELAG